jgi:hypothetical protein
LSKNLQVGFKKWPTDKLFHVVHVFFFPQYFTGSLLPDRHRFAVPVTPKIDTLGGSAKYYAANARNAQKQIKLFTKTNLIIHVAFFPQVYLALALCHSNNNHVYQTLATLLPPSSVQQQQQMHDAATASDPPRDDLGWAPPPPRELGNEPLPQPEVGLTGYERASTEVSRQHEYVALGGGGWDWDSRRRLLDAEASPEAAEVGGGGRGQLHPPRVVGDKDSQR